LTNKDYLQAQLGFTPSNSNVIDAALADISVTGSDVVQGTGETTNSIKYDREAVLKRIAMLEKELGISKASTIQAKHVW
jgi:hypothetical protein